MAHLLGFAKATRGQITASHFRGIMRLILKDDELVRQAEEQSGCNVGRNFLLRYQKWQKKIPNRPVPDQCISLSSLKWLEMAATGEIHKIVIPYEIASILAQVQLPEQEKPVDRRQTTRRRGKSRGEEIIY